MLCSCSSCCLCAVCVWFLCSPCVACVWFLCNLCVVSVQFVLRGGLGQPSPVQGWSHCHAGKRAIFLPRRWKYLFEIAACWAIRGCAAGQDALLVLPLSTEGTNTHLFTVSALTSASGCFSLLGNISFLFFFLFFFPLLL